MARCSLILSNMEKSLGSHECGPKGLSNFGCLPWKCFPLNYYSHSAEATVIFFSKTPVWKWFPLNYYSTLDNVYKKVL